MHRPSPPRQQAISPLLTAASSSGNPPISSAPAPAANAIAPPLNLAQRTTAQNAQITPMPQCYMPFLIVTPAKFNRQPVRLEIVVSLTKQTLATQFNRQQLCSLVQRFSPRNFQISRLPLIHPAR